MTIQQYAKETSLSSSSEVAKVCLLAYFHRQLNGIEEFNVSDAATWLSSLELPKPNASRLRANLKASLDTIKGGKADCFRLHHNFIQAMEAKYPNVSTKSQDVVDHGTILPEIDYQKTRGYIESLAKQINASFEQNIFDGCAVLMRRLMEVLLILSYRHLKIESAIQDGGGNFVMLEAIVGNAKANSTLGLSRNGKASLDKFRELGNFSAHKVEYTCKREYIQPLVQEYRALIGELLHKAGIRV